MTYRNDHDAAQHRVEVLEREVAALRRGASEPTVIIPERSRGARVLGASMVLVALATGFGIAKILTRAPEAASAPIEDVAMGDAGELRLCKANIVRVQKPREIHALAPTAAGCRELLHAHDTLALDPDTRGQIAMWARAEDRLASTIAELVTHEGAGPPELWERYDRAVSARDAVLADLKL